MVTQAITKENLETLAKPVSDLTQNKTATTNYLSNYLTSKITNIETTLKLLPILQYMAMCN